MRVLVVGSGAREDALSWRLASSPSCSALFAAPGNAGTAQRGENWAVAATDGKSLAEKCARAHIDLAVVGPESAIAAGVADRLREAGIATFAPNRSSGRLESSKVFAKRFMERHGVPTARATVVHSYEMARRALDSWSGACVVKADGLAAGKGVVVCDDASAARVVIDEWYTHNRVPGGGSDVLLEERLAGREVSVFAIGDGRAMYPFAAACDYKRAGENDTGPNTGGMGAYSPPLGFPSDLHDVVRERILAPVLRGLLAEGEAYVGVLYCGLMWTAGGPAVIEFNVRFGDPEAQVMLPRVTGDFALFLKSAADGALDPSAIAFRNDACVGVVFVTPEYPTSSTPVDLPGAFALDDGVNVFWGASTRDGGGVHAKGGRAFTVTALGANVAGARENTYRAAHRIGEALGAGCPLFFRSDIAGAVLR